MNGVALQVELLFDRGTQGQAQVGGREVNHFASLSVDVALVLLRERKQFAGNFRLAACQHGVAHFLVRIFLEWDGGCAAVELKRIFVFAAQGGIVAHQRPVAGQHCSFLLLQAVTHVVAMSDAMAISDDQ